MVDPSQWQNDLLKLRMRNLFQPGNVATPPDQLNATPTPQTVDNPTASQAMPQPSNVASDAYTRLMSQMPQRSQFPVSNLQRIGAAMQGMGTGRPAGMWGGVPVGYVGNPRESLMVREAALNQPFDRALSDWQAAEKPAAQAANLEQTRNYNIGRLGETDTLRKIQQENADTRAKAENDLKLSRDELNRIREQNANTRASQEALNEWSKKNPDLKIQVTPQGIFGVNPKSGTAEPITVDGKPIDSGKLSDTDKRMMDFHNKIAEINARIAGQIQVTGVKGVQDRMTVEERADKAKELKETPGAPRETPPDTSTDVVVRDAKGNIVGTKKTDVTRKPRLTPPPVAPPAAVGVPAALAPPVPPAIPSHTPTAPNQPQQNRIRKQIPGTTKIAYSDDNGKTWIAE